MTNPIAEWLSTPAGERWSAGTHADHVSGVFGEVRSEFSTHAAYCDPVMSGTVNRDNDPTGRPPIEREAE